MSKQLNVDAALGDDLVERLQRDNNGAEIGLVAVVFGDDGDLAGVICNMDKEVMEELMIEYAGYLLQRRGMQMVAVSISSPDQVH